MAKDKQLTFLIEEDKRDALKQYCADLGLTISQVLTSYVDSLLSGSVTAQSSTSTSTYNIDVEELVNDTINYHPINKSIEYQDITIEQHDTRIQELENQLIICFDKIENLTKLIQTPTQQPNPSGLSLEDTKQFLTITYKDNLSSKPSERTSQQAIAELLTTGNYPHPNEKKWNRDEVRDICKLWDIKTK